METHEMLISGSQLARRIKQALDESGRAMTEVSEAIGHGPDYIRDFLVGRKKKLSTEALAGIARETNKPLAWLQGDDDAAAAPTQPPAFPDSPAALHMVPFYGNAAGSRLGASHHETDVIDWVPAPPGLARVRDAYMLQVDGLSMFPRFKHRDPIFVAPHQPAWPGDDVVILIRKAATGEYQTWVKELVSINPDEIVTKQYNPADEIRFNRAELVEMHRILPLNELVGVTE